MDTAVALDPILTRFRDAVAELYGPTLDRLVLFGSRARGEARPDSDYDVAVFLRAMPNRWSEIQRLADIELKLFDETGQFIQAIPFRTSDYSSRTPIMHEIRKDGLTL
jgi:predicted nucleotidyltransferase